jgi:molecular chaperone GrpE
MSESEKVEQNDGAAVSGPEQEADQAQSAASGEAVSAVEQQPELTETVAVDVPALQSELESLALANKTLQEEALRAQAEAQNTRRRAEKEVENAHKFGIEKFVKELVPMLDSLESGLEKIPEDDQAQQMAREGLSLTLKQGLEALKKFSVEQVHPLGQPFDPAMHQAMAMQESPDAAPNTVLHVMQKGYTLSGRLIRPAMVVVSKAAATQKVDESV